MFTARLGTGAADLGTTTAAARTDALSVVSEECVRRLLPDPILHKLVLAQMNDTISEQLPNFYNNLLQYRAYTAYKMCLEEAPAESATSEPTQQQLIGSCWAKMTGKPQDPAHCQLGSRLYQWMKARCEQLVCSVQFQTV